MDATPDAAGWSNVSQVYSQVEGLTLPLAEKLVKRIQTIRTLDTPGLYAFDNGCGTGVLTTILKQSYPSLKLIASDASDGMIKLLKTRAEEAGWKQLEMRVVDGRNLEGIANDSFTHSFSTFMICLAPDPDVIVEEMFRVTKPGGLLGLAVWGEPYFRFFNGPWTQACRTLLPEYEPVKIMGEDWTRKDEIKTNLEKLGWKNTDVWEEPGVWPWASVKALSEYFLKGGNPGNDLMIGSFRDQGGDVERATEVFEEIVMKEYGTPEGTVRGEVLASFATARK